MFWGIVENLNILPLELRNTPCRAQNRSKFRKATYAEVTNRCVTTYSVINLFGTL